MALAGLYTCDLVCWGAASPPLFADYLAWLEGHFGSRVVAFRHRAKGNWEGTRPMATLADGREVSGRDVDLWQRLWYGRLLRPSCNCCGLHSTNRLGDVTIGDYWGLDGAHPGLTFGDGTSCLVVNDAAGAELVSACGDELRLVPSEMGLCANDKQPMLLRSPEALADRGAFWGAYYARGFNAASCEVGAIQKRNPMGMAKNAAKHVLRLLLSKKNNVSAAAVGQPSDAGWKEAEVKAETVKERGGYPLVYAAKNSSDDVRRHSASGGMFHALASTVISQGGVVYGCAFDDDLRAVHIRCETMAEAERCMGSKYSQSHMGDTIKGIVADLKADRTVLFTGTPCEVAAVRACCENLRGGVV